MLQPPKTPSYRKGGAIEALSQTSFTYGLKQEPEPRYRNLVSRRAVVVSRPALDTLTKPPSPPQPPALPIHSYGYSTVEDTKAHWPLEAARRRYLEEMSDEVNKKEMHRKHYGFSSRIEQVRYEVAQKRRLAGELENLQSHWQYGAETGRIRGFYRAELEQAKQGLIRARYSVEKGLLEVSEVSNVNLHQDPNQWEKKQRSLRSGHAYCYSPSH